MKKSLSVLAILAVAMAAQANVCQFNPAGARDGKTMNGPTLCTEGNAGIDHINGVATVKRTIFDHAVKVNGPLVARGATFKGQLTVNGPVTLIDTHAKNLQVKGELTVIDSHVGPVEVWSSYIKFKQSHVASITAHAVNSDALFSHANVTRLYLLDHTVVNGNVTFLGHQKNLLHRSDNSMIKGHVYHAKK